ncbi:hypothetical protein PFISCL1PPCAC_15567, partial [Pristionchus fissidentatus]
LQYPPTLATVHLGILPGISWNGARINVNVLQTGSEAYGMSTIRTRSTLSWHSANTFFARLGAKIIVQVSRPLYRLTAYGSSSHQPRSTRLFHAISTTFSSNALFNNYSILRDPETDIEIPIPHTHLQSTIIEREEEQPTT